MASKQQSVIGSLFLWPPTGSHREDQNSSQVGRGFKMEFGCGCVYTREDQGCFCSVAQCPTLCDPMDSSTPGFPVLHHLPELAQTHVHWVGDTIQPSHPLPSPFPPAVNLTQHQGLFQWVCSLHQAWGEALELWGQGINPGSPRQNVWITEESHREGQTDEWTEVVSGLRSKGLSMVGRLMVFEDCVHFSPAAGGNDHECSGLNPHGFTILRSRDQVQRGWQGCGPSEGGGLWGEAVCCLFQLLEPASIPRLGNPSSVFKASFFQPLSDVCAHPHIPSDLLSSSWKDPRSGPEHPGSSPASDPSWSLQIFFCPQVVFTDSGDQSEDTLDGFWMHPHELQRGAGN